MFQPALSIPATLDSLTAFPGALVLSYPPAASPAGQRPWRLAAACLSPVPMGLSKSIHVTSESVTVTQTRDFTKEMEVYFGSGFWRLEVEECGQRLPSRGGQPRAASREPGREPAQETEHQGAFLRVSCSGLLESKDGLRPSSGPDRSPSPLSSLVAGFQRGQTTAGHPRMAFSSPTTGFPEQPPATRSPRKPATEFEDCVSLRSPSGWPKSTPGEMALPADVLSTHGLRRDARQAEALETWASRQVYAAPESFPRPVCSPLLSRGHGIRSFSCE